MKMREFDNFAEQSWTDSLRESGPDRREGRAAVPRCEQSHSSPKFNSHCPTGFGVRYGQGTAARRRRLDRMKAILQATFAAVLSGILVGVLLKNRVTVAIKR